VSAQSPLTEPFRIGDVEIANRVLLAPLAGIGNWFVRLQARRHGAGLAVSEMVSSHAIHYGNERTLNELRVRKRLQMRTDRNVVPISNDIDKLATDVLDQLNSRILLHEAHQHAWHHKPGDVDPDRVADGSDRLIGSPTHRAFRFVSLQNHGRCVIVELTACLGHYDRP